MNDEQQAIATQAHETVKMMMLGVMSPQEAVENHHKYLQAHHEFRTKKKTGRQASWEVSCRKLIALHQIGINYLMTMSSYGFSSVGEEDDDTIRFVADALSYYRHALCFGAFYDKKKAGKKFREAYKIELKQFSEAVESIRKEVKFVKGGEDGKINVQASN